MFVPWISAAKIIEDSEGDQEIFHNFTLGLPFVSKDTSLTREAILRCLHPGSNPKTDVAMGVDVGLLKHYVIGNRYGIFKVGKTESWEEIEEIRNLYDAICVIDALPYPAPAMSLSNKYPGKVYVHYYQQDRKKMGVIRWEEQIVKSDRTKMIDSVVAEINSRDMKFQLTAYDLDEYITHCRNIYRIVKMDPRGIAKPEWINDDRPDHFFHATVYFRVALEQTLGQGSIVDPIAAPSSGEKHPYVQEDSTVPALDLQRVVQRAAQRKITWKGI